MQGNPSRRLSSAERWAAKATIPAPKVLANAPVQPEPYYGPIMCCLEPIIVDVDLEPVDALAPGGDWRLVVGKPTAANFDHFEQLLEGLVASRRPREYAAGARESLAYAQGARQFSHRNDARAALRAQATAAHDFGPKIEVAALMVDGDTVRRVVFRGTLAAIRQALPDEGTVASWTTSGVQEAVAWDFKATRRTVRWVDPSEAPKPIQLELASRAPRH